MTVQYSPSHLWQHEHGDGLSNRLALSTYKASTNNRKQTHGSHPTNIYTAYDKYMMSAIRQSAFDYLLKPFEDKDLELIISRFMERIELERKAAFFPAALANTSQTFMVFTPTNDMRALRPAEIGYFRYCSERKQWEAVLSGQTPLPLKKSTTADQIVRYAPCFVQIHQSFIINIDYLMIIKDGKCVLYPPFENVDELLVSKKYKKELQDRYCL